jgi:hypothetical protein
MRAPAVLVLPVRIELTTSPLPSAEDRSFPKTSQHLSRELDRLKPALRTMGIFVEHGEKTRRGRLVRVWADDQNPSAGTANPGGSVLF